MLLRNRCQPAYDKNGIVPRSRLRGSDLRNKVVSPIHKIKPLLRGRFSAAGGIL